MFCCGDRVATGGVHDNDAVLGCGFDVHVIDANACTTDDLEVFGGFENCWSDLRLATDHKTVELGNDLDQFLLLEASFHHDLDNTSLGKGFDSTLGNWVCDENFGNAAHGMMVMMVFVFWDDAPRGVACPCRY